MSMQNLQEIRKKRAALSTERQRIKKESMNLRLEEQDEKNSILNGFLNNGNFEQTHGDVRRVKPRWRGWGMSDDMRKMMDEWDEECRVYDAARKRLIEQKVKLLYSLQDSS